MRRSDRYSHGTSDVLELLEKPDTKGPVGPVAVFLEELTAE